MMGKEHWVEVKIKDIFSTASGGTPSTFRSDFWEKGDVNWINSGALKDDIITKPTHFITKLGLDNSSAKLFPVNTVLIALTGATTGKVGLLKIECSTNQSVTGILPIDSYEPQLLFWFHIFNRDNLLAQSLGSAQPHINKAIIDNLVIPLPPLAEQKRIVAKLDAILPRVKSAKARLERIPVILKKFRQGVLAAACSGKLTEGWRKEDNIA
jgi:type I restriction enzyme S subunit